MPKLENAYSKKNIPRLNQARIGLVTSAASYPGKAQTASIQQAAIEVLSSKERILVAVMLLLGSAMQAYANMAFEAFFMALFLLLIGRAVIALVFPSRKPETRAFLLTYAVCIFVGGLAQNYSLAVFNMVQSTIDARGFFWQISSQPPFRTFETVSQFGTPLAILIWQQFYKLTWWLGFEFGPYTGVMVNAMTMGLVAGLIVQIARELFGDDIWRLGRVGTLAAANGLFILFGAVLLRDSFTTFFMTLVLWGGVRFLVRANMQSLLIAIAATVISAWAMQYLRSGAFLLIFLYGILAFLFGVLRRTGFIGIPVITAILIVVFVGGSFLSVYIQDVQEIQTFYLEKYSAFSARTAADDSLGILLMVNQPLPIRIAVGTVSLFISPIPLWAFFNFDSRDYHWIKAYHGIYQLFVVPFVFAGSLAAFRLFFKDKKKSWPLMFLVVFMLINMIGVLSSSGESRHFGQFMSAFVIVAAIPDTRDEKTKNELGRIKAFWFFGVLLVHIAWGLLKIAL